MPLNASLLFVLFFLFLLCLVLLCLSDCTYSSPSSLSKFKIQDWDWAGIWPNSLAIFYYPFCSPCLSPGDQQPGPRMGGWIQASKQASKRVNKKKGAGSLLLLPSSLSVCAPCVLLLHLRLGYLQLPMGQWVHEVKVDVRLCLCADAYAYR
jgi:hypothetical protein